MPVPPVAIVLVLVGIDYGLWRWATHSDNGTLAVVAGLAMAPLAVALTWLAAVSLAAGAVRVLRILRPAPTPRRRPRPVPVVARSEDPATTSQRVAA